MILSDEELIEKWKGHFKDLLNVKQKKTHKEETYMTVDLPVEEPSLEETQMATNKLKNSKAPGSDQIPAEFLKYGGDALHRQIHRLITLIWRKEKIPAGWRESIIVPIHKKWDKSKCSNYRGISLINTTYKVLSNILLCRLTPYAKKPAGGIPSRI